MSVPQYVADHAPVTARDVADAVGQEKGLVRATVLTVLERLRQKGRVTRRRKHGIFHYSPRLAQADLLRLLVGQLIAKTLGSAVSPVVAYLVGNRQIADSDLAELDWLVEELKAERKTHAAARRNGFAFRYLREVNRRDKSATNPSYTAVAPLKSKKGSENDTSCHSFGCVGGGLRRGGDCHLPAR